MHPTGKNAVALQAMPWSRKGRLIMISVCVLMVGVFIAVNNFSQNRAVEIEYGNALLAEHRIGTVRAAGLSTERLTQNTAPSAYLPKPFHDFGRLNPDHIAKITFTLSNLGDSPLIIHNAYTTCTCARAEISTQSITPGKAALITVQLVPDQTHFSSGVIRRGVLIETNDPLQPWIEIWVQARLDPARGGNQGGLEK